jgi:hypothetical protein
LYLTGGANELCWESGRKPVTAKLRTVKTTEVGKKVRGSLALAMQTVPLN